MVNKRKSNIELLRIIAMILIVASHYAGHGVMQSYSPELELSIWSQGSFANKLFACFFGSGGAGVAVFFMISGYFLRTDDKFHFKKIFSEVIFYSWLCLFIAFFAKLLGYDFWGISKGSLIVAIIRSIFIPVTSGKTWWFVTSYVFLDLIHPLINNFFNKLKRKFQIRVLVFLWFFWIALGLLCDNSFIELQKAVFFYLIGSYIASQNTKKTSKYICTILILFGWVCSAFSVYYKNLLFLEGGIANQIFKQILQTVNGSVFEFQFALGIMLLGSGAKVYYNSLINKIAQTTFGIYLFHNNVFIRSIVWHKIFKVDSVQFFSPFFSILAFTSVVVVFGFCCLLDMFRIKYFEKKMFILFEKIKTFVIGENGWIGQNFMK